MIHIQLHHTSSFMRCFYLQEQFLWYLLNHGERRKVLLACHVHPISGHMGERGLCAGRIKEHFMWHGMMCVSSSLGIYMVNVRILSSYHEICTFDNNSLQILFTFQLTYCCIRLQFLIRFQLTTCDMCQWRNQKL